MGRVNKKKLKKPKLGESVSSGPSEPTAKAKPACIERPENSRSGVKRKFNESGNKKEVEKRFGSEECRSGTTSSSKDETTESVLESDVDSEQSSLTDIEISSDELTGDRYEDLMDDNAKELIEFDFEAFPIQDDDKDGLVNMLTQIFLRSAIDLESISNALIAQSPFGSVIGPAEVDDGDDDGENVVYGVLSVLPLESTEEAASTYTESVVDFVLEKSKKFGLKETSKIFGKILELPRKVGLLINERMLNFPTQIIAPSFSSLRNDIDALPQPYAFILYIHKLRIADEDTESAALSNPGDAKKGKKGKAEKKRLALAKREHADVIYDNIEDSLLMEGDVGTIYHFDYPVHQDVDPGSKFHIVERNGKKYKPFRRVVLMDNTRFSSFIDELSSFSPES